MKKVAFICVHNSCRSQIAEAREKGDDTFIQVIQAIEKKMLGLIEGLLLL